MERCCDPRNSTTSAITCRGYKLLECSRAIFVVSTRLSSTLYYLLTTRTIFDRVLIDPFDLCPVCSLQVSHSSIVLVAASGRRQCVFRLRPSAIPRPPIQGHNCIQHHVPQSSSHLVHQSSAFAHNTDYIYIQLFLHDRPLSGRQERGVYISVSNLPERLDATSPQPNIAKHACSSRKTIPSSEILFLPSHMRSRSSDMRTFVVVSISRVSDDSDLGGLR